MRCYRRGPKHLRDRRATLGRKKGQVSDPKRKWHLERMQARCIDLIVKALNAEPTGNEMSPAMREQLRKDGLL